MENLAEEVTFEGRKRAVQGRGLFLDIMLLVSSLVCIFAL